MVKVQMSYPCELIAMDVMVLPKSRNGNIAVLVAVDNCSKWLSVVPMKNKANTIANAVRDRVLPAFPKLPSKCLTDIGPEFKSQEFNDLLGEFDINHIW